VKFIAVFHIDFRFVIQNNPVFEQRFSLVGVRDDSSVHFIMSFAI